MRKGIILNLYLPNNIDSKHAKERLNELQEERDSHHLSRRFGTSSPRMNE